MQAVATDGVSSERTRLLPAQSNRAQADSLERQLQVESNRRRGEWRPHVRERRPALALQDHEAKLVIAVVWQIREASLAPVFYFRVFCCQSNKKNA